MRIYTDGSGLEPQWPELRRAGWAWVLYDSSGEEAVRRAAPLTGWHQTVPRAETYAVLDVLRWLYSRSGLSNCVADVASDCNTVVDECWRMVEGRRDFFRSLQADLWREIDKLVMQLRCRGVVVLLRWIPSHCTEVQVQSGLISRQDWQGNDLADRMSKEAAAVHAVPDPVAARYKQRFEFIVKLATYLADSYIHARSDGKWDCPAELECQRPVAAAVGPRLVVVARTATTDDQRAYSAPRVGGSRRLHGKKISCLQCRACHSYRIRSRSLACTGRTSCGSLRASTGAESVARLHPLASVVWLRCAR